MVVKRTNNKYPVGQRCRMMRTEVCLGRSLGPLEKTRAFGMTHPFKDGTARLSGRTTISHRAAIIGALELRVLPGFSANLIPGGGTNCGRPGPCLQSGSGRSSWFLCRHSECAGLCRRILDTVRRSGRGLPCPREKRSLFRGRRRWLRRGDDRSKIASVCCVAANSFSHSCGLSFWVSASGESCAACRISSE